MKKPVIMIYMNEGTEDRLWSNGLFQNVFTLYGMLEKTERYDVYILFATSKPPTYDFPESITLANKSIKVAYTTRLFTFPELYPTPDLILEIGAEFGEVSKPRLMATFPDLKIVYIQYGNHLFTHMHALTGQITAKETSVACERNPKDAVWCSPHYERSIPFNKLHFKTDNVQIAPYVWSSMFVDDKFMRTGRTVSKNYNNIAILEPNITVQKNSLIPLTIAEATNDLRPEIINQVIAYGTERWTKIDTDTGKYATRAMLKYDIAKQRKAKFVGRYQFTKIFSGKGDDCGIMLAWHHLNGLNYTYLEAFHLGIPLVHNSEWFKDAGYYYEEWDVQQGRDMLIRAIETGDNFSNEYKEAAKKYLWKYSPDNPENVDGYVRLIEEILN